MNKKIICLLVTAVMLISALPVAAGGEYSTYRDYFPFEDIVKDEWYTPAVEFCYVNGYMQGVSESEFNHSGIATREQMMMILANMTGEDISEYTESSFSDVEAGQWYTAAVAWAQERGYTNGIGNGKFGLGKTITREETVTVFYNYAVINTFGQAVAEDLSEFTDGDTVSDWANEAMRWACENDVIKGNNNKIDPQGNLTRAQAAQLIYNIQLNCLHTYHEHDFADASCTEPSKCISKEGILDKCELLLAPAKGHRVDINKMCEEFTQCIECGEDVFTPMGHDYKAASCTDPMTCERCGKQKGEALGHTSEKDICLRCGKEFFANGYEKLTYFLKNKGMTNGSTKYFYAEVTYNKGGSADQYITYDGKDIYFENTFKFASSRDKLNVKLKLDVASDSLGYTFEYFKNGSAAYSGSGTIKASAYKKETKLVFDFYNGDSVQKEDLEALLSNSMVLNLDGASYLLEKEAGMKLLELGFTSF